MNRLHLYTIAVLGTLAAACTEDVDSNDIKTSGIYAEMEVLATGNGEATVTVGLKPGGRNSNTYLVMEGEDELVATAEDTDQTLTKSGNYYKTTFDTDAGGTEFVVAFNRAAEDVSAPDSSATLPEPFAIGDVAATVSRAESLTVTWDPAASGDDMRWTLDGDCLFPTSGSMSDSGTLTLATDDFDVHSGSEEETCSVDLCIERSRDGQVDPAFGEGGDFVAIQRRCVSFSSAP